MEWEDARIVKLRNEERKKRYSDLSTGMYIKEQLLSFEKYHIEDLEISLILPSEFSGLSQDIINRKYPSLDRPDIVIGNKAADSVFAFSRLQDHIDHDDLRKDTINVLKTMIRSSNPAIIFFEEGIFRNAIMSCCWFDFKSYVITGLIYNFTSIVSFKKRTVLGMFSCPYELALWWKPIYLKIIESFEEEEG